MRLIGNRSHAHRSAIGTILRITLLASAVIIAASSSAHALQIGDTVETAWWNVNAAGCGGTAAAPDSGGDRAVKSLSKLEVLSQVGQKKAFLHLNTDTFYDPGAAQAGYLFPILFGRAATCSEIAAFVGTDKWHTFRDVACRTDVSAAWKQRLAGFCALPDSVVWDWYDSTKPSRVYAFMLGEYLDGSGCAATAGARSEDRLYWNKLKAKYGKHSSPIGSFTVLVDAITIDVGVAQQRILDPGMVASTVTFWNNIAWYAVANTWPAKTVTGRNGNTLFDIGWYEYFFQTYVPFSLPGTAQKLYSQHLADQRTLDCAGNPDAKAGFDPQVAAGKEATDGAMRNLFDKLATVSQGTDVICSDKAICGNLYDFAKTIYALPDHGKSLIKAWIVKLIRG